MMDEPIVSIEAYLDDEERPFIVCRPPARISIDTATLIDGPHRLRLLTVKDGKTLSERRIPFSVQNGPGITVTGLRAQSTVSGELTLNVNAFGSDEPFDPSRAESQSPVPVWVWVMILGVVGWAGWYGIEQFPVPAAFAQTPTYAQNAEAAGLTAFSGADAAAPPSYSGKGSAGGFDYGATGPALYTQNCSACHGASGTGVPGAFPPLAGDPVVNDKSPTAHITTVLHGLANKVIGGTKYSSQMPAFSQLSDADIAAIIDHERTSWGNSAPVITPADVKRAR